MKSRVCLFLALSSILPLLSMKAQAASYCQQPTSALQNGTVIVQAELSGRLYQKAFLKIAQRMSLENVSTLESYAATLSTRLNKEKIEAFKSTYVQFAHENTYEAFILNLKKTDYWKTALRLDNSQAALVAVLAGHLGEISFTASELEVLWLSQVWPARDEWNISKQLAQISGAIGKKRPLSVSEFQTLIKNHLHDCSLPSEQELKKTLRTQMWSLYDNKEALRSTRDTILLGAEKVVTFVSYRLPDQSLRQGSARQTDVIAYEKTDFRTYFKDRNAVNEKSNTDVIQYFHKHFARAPYLVVDKAGKTIQYFNEQGHLLTQTAAESYRGDELNTGGSGLYFYSGRTGDFHFLQAEKDLLIRAAFRANLSIPVGTAIYILPETTDHRFRIRNHRLSFGAAKVFRNRPAYNYSPLMREGKAVSIQVATADTFAKAYVQALQDEKLTLMEIMKVEDDEYNLLAEFAFGVMAPETDYGRNWKYRLKETAPFIISILKGNGLNTDENSRGPTQIKRIPEAVVTKYGIDKSDLKEARAAAIATVAFSAELLRDLRNAAYMHPGIKEENLQEYLYYLYQGRRWEIRDATATPEKNANIRKIMKAIELLRITEN